MWNEQWSHHLAQEDVDALIEGGRLMDFTHDFVSGEGWKQKEPMPLVTAKEVNERSIGSLGHDSINQWVCVRAKCQREGVEQSCAHCNGEGAVWQPLEAEERAESWENVEPPAGEGYQLWETVSEGSPISPVMADPRELANWCADNATIFASEKLTALQWLQMIVGEEDADTQSMMIGMDGYFGSVANLNERTQSLWAATQRAENQSGEPSDGN